MADDLLPFDDLRPAPPGPSDGPKWLNRADGRIFVSRYGQPQPSLLRLSSEELALVQVENGRATLEADNGR